MGRLLVTVVTVNLTLIDSEEMYGTLKAVKGVPKAEQRLLRGALVLELHDLHGLPLANIAEAVGRSPATVKQILARREVIVECCRGHSRKSI